MLGEVAVEIAVVGSEDEGAIAVDADVLRRPGVARSGIDADAGKDLDVVAVDEAQAPFGIALDEGLHIVGIDASVPPAGLPGVSGVIGELLFLDPDRRLRKEVDAGEIAISPDDIVPGIQRGTSRPKDLGFKAETGGSDPFAGIGYGQISKEDLMRVPNSRAWISVALLVASTAVALPDAPKVAAKAAARKSVVQTRESQSAMTPARAVDALKEGNARFHAGTSVQKNLLAKVKASAAGQYPFAVVLSCMDSRVPVEAIFDQSIGDLFSIRVAGNVVNADNLGSLEYATKVIGVKVIVVLGHTSCGAVKGAIDNAKLGNLTELVAKIQPAVAASGPGTSKDHAYVDKVGEENVRLAMNEIREKSPVVKEMLDSGAVRLVGAMYDLESGAVTFFEK